MDGMTKPAETLTGQLKPISAYAALLQASVALAGVAAFKDRLPEVARADLAEAQKLLRLLRDAAP